MQAVPDISVVIVSYNCLESLGPCLDSICSQDGVSSETIVVDNDSRDGTADYLISRNTNAILSNKNLGFGAGANLGASRAAGKYIFFLNPDTELPPGTLAALLDFARSNPDFGLISALLIDGRGQVQISARKFPSRRDFLFGRGSVLFRLGLAAERDAGYISDPGEAPLQVEAVSGTALFVSRELFERLNGFDRRFFMYLEDIDLCRRVAALKHPVWILPPVKVLHRWRQSSKTRPYFTSMHHHLSVYKYFHKYYPYEWFLNAPLAAALFAGFLATCLMTLFGRGGRK